MCTRAHTEKMRKSGPSIPSNTTSTPTITYKMPSRAITQTYFLLKISKHIDRTQPKHYFREQYEINLICPH